MICLDTSFLIDLFKERIIIDDNLKAYLEKELVITPFSVFELYHGIYRLKAKNPEFNFQRRETDLRLFYNKFTIIDFNQDAAIKAAEIKDFLEKHGKVIDIVDIMIASIAIVQNCDSIITRNINHFERISELNVIGYEMKKTD